MQTDHQDIKSHDGQLVEGLCAVIFSELKKKTFKMHWFLENFNNFGVLDFDPGELVMMSSQDLNIYIDTQF